MADKIKRASRRTPRRLAFAAHYLLGMDAFHGVPVLRAIRDAVERVHTVCKRECMHGAVLAVKIRYYEVQAPHQGEGIRQEHALAGFLEQAQVG